MNREERGAESAAANHQSVKDERPASPWFSCALQLGKCLAGRGEFGARAVPARSSYGPAGAQQISNALAPLPPLRPGRPRSVGCSSAAQYDNSLKTSRAAGISPGARRCARSTSRSRVAAREASDFTGRPRRFGAAAAGPRRTQPRSFGCGTAALCSSCVCGSKDSVRLHGCALMVLPGPAFIVIPAGLAILAVEFACARHWLRSPRVHRCFCKIATAERFAYDPGEQTVRAVDGGCEIGSLKR